MIKNISGYTKEDIESLIKRIYQETEENRDRALKLYDHMENAMVNNKGDLIVLSQMADRYIEQASRQTEILVKLGQVMQRLQQYEDKDLDAQKTIVDINQILEQMDLQKMSPFVIRGISKEIVKSKTIQEEIAPVKNEETKVDLEKKEDDVELETNL